MKKTIMYSLIIFLVLNLTSCAMAPVREIEPQFYGSYGRYAESNYIEASAALDKGLGRFILYITNRSDYPIEFNFFSDTYYITLKNGKVYKCRTYISGYPSYALNPNTRTKVNAWLGRGLSVDDIEKITMTINYGKTTIDLYSH